MKKFLLFFIPLCFIFSAASAEKWELVQSYPAGYSIFIDTDQLDLIKDNLHNKDPEIAKRTEQSIKRIWVKMAIAEPKAEQSYLKDLIVLSEYDFTKNSSRSVYMSALDKDGKSLGDQVNDASPWQPIQAGDVPELIGKYVKNYLSLK